MFRSLGSVNIKYMLISIKVKIHSKDSEVIKAGEMYEVRVKARPIEGRANQEVIRLLSEFFGVPKSRIVIKSGLKSKHKVIEIV